MVSGAQAQGTDGSFESVRKLLKSDAKQTTFAIGGPAFLRQRRSLHDLCARLEDGSYTMQKIVSDRVPIRFGEIHH
jgi:hypothetical protein